MIHGLTYSIPLYSSQASDGYQGQTPESARAALESVIDPLTQKTLGELKLVRRADVVGGAVHAEVELFSHAPTAREVIYRSAREKPAAPGVSSLEPPFTPNVRTSPASGQDPVPQVNNCPLVKFGTGRV